jgi:hypothetical protein
MIYLLGRIFYAYSSYCLVILLLLIGILFFMMRFSYAENVNPNVFPVSSKPYGLTYGEWAARFWQWLHSIPKPDNPAADTTGKNCALKQAGPIWFLPGTFGGTNERTCTIPEGKAILVTPIEVMCSFAEHHLKTESELRACAKADQDKVTSATITVDGVQVKTYRLQSPLFSVTLPKNNALLEPADNYSIS